MSILSNDSPNTNGRLMIPNWRCGIDWCKSNSTSYDFDSCRNLGLLSKHRLHLGTHTSSEMSENTFLLLGLEMNFTRCLREMIFSLNSYSLDTCNGNNACFFFYLSPDIISHRLLERFSNMKCKWKIKVINLNISHPVINTICILTFHLLNEVQSQIIIFPWIHVSCFGISQIVSIEKNLGAYLNSK